ncbi:O-antigen ligase family protein [Henriciella aquimarina]|uniref:O-antigen ligase family protein n=1 Tax=Henriciella aquimarina TaxID=545261 RepID=UPI000A03B2FA|nr:O-antigen ligase [Henriciella aquimarina]
MPASLTVSQDRPPLATLARIMELAAVFACLVLFTEGLLPRLFASEENPDSAFLRLLWLPVYGLVGLGCLFKFRAVLHATMRLPFLMLILALACLSWLWSIDPAVTERRAIAIAATTAAGLFLAVRYDWRTLLRMLGAVWLFLGVISFAAGIVVPAFAVMDDIHVGAWRGLWWEKNAMGGHMARAAFLMAFLALMDRPWRLIWAGGIVLCTALVVLSTSKTALLGLLTGFAVLGAAVWMRRGIVSTLSLIWLGAILTGVIGLVLIVNPALFFEVLGRDATLTGRTDIWTALFDAIGARPWFGYGYAAFWGADSQPAYMVRLATEWAVPTAHNGWIETALSIGLVGLVGLALNFLLMIARSAWLAVTDWTGIYALGMCAQFLLFSISESIALQQNTIVWVTYVAIAAKVAVTVREKTLASRRMPAPGSVSAIGRKRFARPVRRPGLVRTR